MRIRKRTMGSDSSSKYRTSHGWIVVQFRHLHKHFKTGLLLFVVLVILWRSFYPSNSLLAQDPSHTTTPPIYRTKLNKTLAVIGAARDVERHLDTLRVVIQRATRNFDIVYHVFFENDSKDNTLHILESSWKGSLVNVEIVSVPHLHPPNAKLAGARTENLAHARNTLLERVVSFHNHRRHIDYVLAVDLDTVNYELENIESCLELPDNWSVCCANQKNMHYDLWALRTLDDWVDCDVLETCGGTWLGQWFPFFNIAARLRHIPPSADPIRVQSCFGGAALYNFETIRHVPPNSFVGTQVNHVKQQTVPVCEHVSFNEAIRLANPDNALYIQPKMRNVGNACLIQAPALVILFNCVFRNLYDEWFL